MLTFSFELMFAYLYVKHDASAFRFQSLCDALHSGLRARKSDELCFATRISLDRVLRNDTLGKLANFREA